MAEKTKEELLAEEGYVAIDKDNEVQLQTHDMINKAFSGDLVSLEVSKAVVSLTTTEDMLVDRHGLIHGGFIFAAADFAAMAAVNDKNVVLASAKSEFLSPVKVGDIVIFTALVKQKDGRKRVVKVEGHLGKVKVFTAELKTVITERHVLKLDLVDSAGGDI